MKFACSSCGSCCTRVGLNMETLKKLGFPYEVKPGTNTCEKFNDLTRECTVYLNRPDCCNVDKMFYKIHSLSGFSKKEVFKREASICNEFIKEENLDDKFLIDINQYS